MAAQAWYKFCNTFVRCPGVEINSLLSLKSEDNSHTFSHNLGSTRHRPPSAFAIWLEQLWWIKLYFTALVKSRNTVMHQEHIKHYQQIPTFAMESRKNEEVSEILLCQSRWPIICWHLSPPVWTLCNSDGLKTRVSVPLEECALQNTHVVLGTWPQTPVGGEEVPGWHTGARS